MEASIDDILDGKVKSRRAKSATVTTPNTQDPVAMVGGAYDGASRFDRDLVTWTPNLRSADDDVLPAKTITDARVRDTFRNDSYVASGAAIHKDSIVGSQFRLNSRPNYKVLGLSEEWANAFQQEVEAKFTLYAESPEHYIDASRMNTFTGMIRLAIGVYLMTGETLATVEWVNEPGRLFRTAIQMVDTDRLSNPDGIMDSPRLKRGVALDARGAPVGYHISTAHPNDLSQFANRVWKYVPLRKTMPAGRLNVIHILEQDRVDQHRGISALVSSLKEIRITRNFRDTVLQNAILNATFAATIESELPPQAVFEALGANARDPISAAAEKTLAGISRYAGGAKNLNLNGVRVPHLYPGTKLNMQPAGQGGPLGTEFEQSLLRYLAASLNVSYEQLSKDFSKTNYSSMRAASLETWKFMQSRKKMVADRFASLIFRLWLEEAIHKLGFLESMPANAPSWYEGMNKEAYSACTWIGAARGQVDELKETQAAALRIATGLSTLEDELARNGLEWREVLDQREREKKELEARGLLLDTTNSQNMLNALTTPSNEDEGTNDDEETDDPEE